MSPPDGNSSFEALKIETEGKGLSDSEKIKKSEERIDQALKYDKRQNIEGCPHAGKIKDEEDEFNCIERTEKAKELAITLANDIDKSDAELPKDKEGQEKGKMVGVLICIDKVGNTVVLQAYSGYWEAQNDDKWCPSIKKSYKKDLKESRDAIKKAAKTLDDAEYKNDNLDSYIKRKYYNKGRLLKEGLSEQDRQKIITDMEKERQNTELAFNDALSQYEKAIEKHKQIEDEAQKPLMLSDSNNNKKTLQAASISEESAAHQQTGICAAPKMLAHAAAMGYTPVALAEAWVGPNSDYQGGTRKQGEEQDSCPQCQSILGHMLNGRSGEQGQLAKTKEMLQKKRKTNE